MNIIHRIGLLLVCITWAAQSQAAITPITGVSIDNTYTVWEETNNDGVLFNIGAGSNPLEQYLTGTAADPGDNIELGNDFDYSAWAGGELTTLTGTVDGKDVLIRSLNLGDWASNGNSLALAYVNAALASIGKSSADWIDSPGGSTPDRTFNEAVNHFIFGDSATTSGAFVASDPNVGYVYSDPDVKDDQVKVGLQGLYDATALLSPLFPYVDYTPAPGELVQASEVMYLSFLGSSGYSYSFTATETNQGASDCYDGTGTPSADCSYTGNYEISRIPAPSGIALLMLGLTGIIATRRRTMAAGPKATKS